MTVENLFKMFAFHLMSSFTLRAFENFGIAAELVAGLRQTSLHLHLNLDMSLFKA